MMTVQNEVVYIADTKTWAGSVDGVVIADGLGRDEAYNLMRATAMSNGGCFTMYNRKGGVSLSFTKFRGNNKNRQQSDTPLVTEISNNEDVAVDVLPNNEISNNEDFEISNCVELPTDDIETTDIDLDSMTTIELVEHYNQIGGNITGKYKGSRMALIAKIMKLQG